MPLSFAERAVAQEVEPEGAVDATDCNAGCTDPFPGYRPTVAPLGGARNVRWPHVGLGPRLQGQRSADAEHVAIAGDLPARLSGTLGDRDEVADQCCERGGDPWWGTQLGERCLSPVRRVRNSECSRTSRGCVVSVSRGTRSDVVLPLSAAELNAMRCSAMILSPAFVPGSDRIRFPMSPRQSATN